MRAHAGSLPAVPPGGRRVFMKSDRWRRLAADRAGGARLGDKVETMVWACCNRVQEGQGLPDRPYITGLGIARPILWSWMRGSRGGGGGTQVLDGNGYQLLNACEERNE